MSDRSENEPVVIEGLSPAEISGEATRALPPDPAPVAQPPALQRRRGGFGGTVLGGIIAAALGYGTAAWLGDASWPFRPTGAAAVDTTALKTEVDALATAVAATSAAPAAEMTARLTDLTGRVDALAAELADFGARPVPTVTDVAAVSEAVSALDARLSQMETAPRGGSAAPAAGSEVSERDLVALGARVATLEAGMAEGADVPAAVAAATEAATARIAEAGAALDATRAQTAALTSAANIRTALASVGLALDMGGDVAGAAAAAQAAGATLDPAAVAEAPALVDLQRSFPDAARRALAAAARAPEGSGLGARMGAFVKGQFAPRSLTPQDGDSADAILSRAEAALRRGRVADALAALAALPEPAQPALADWLAAATAHAAARAAVEAALTALPSN